jgi:protein translocase SecG subunit
LPSAAAPFVFHQATFAEQYPWFLNIVQSLFLVSTLALIALMAVQTTKTEGLSGSIGGRAESAYHGRLGLDQQITRLTSLAAYSWIILAVIFFVATR